VLDEGYKCLVEAGSSANRTGDVSGFAPPETSTASATPSRRRRLAVSCWWPGAEWLADLPLVTEWVDDPAESPAVLVADG